MLYNGTATVAGEISSNPWNLNQGILRMLTGAGIDDTPTLLNREGTTEPALKGHGQQSQI